MERVLVTGAGGYIGTSLVPMLLAAGYQVRALDRFFFGRELLPQHERLELVRADSRRLEPAYFDGVDHVVDLVAISSDPSGELFQDRLSAGLHRRRPAPAPRRGAQEDRLVAGRQIVSAERIEVLALGATAALPDGKTLAQTLAVVRAAGA